MKAETSAELARRSKINNSKIARFGFERIEDVQLNAAEEVLTGVLASQRK